ncbi:MAG TPA: NADH-quinone oxidoreductase subunit J [Chloroflexota bacterium]|nr:NADH-quinone oxidoreductase subunit J [Chloroflexota bacterium]
MGMIAFVIIAVVAIVGAAGMVLSRNAVHSALLLVANLFCVALLYLSLNADFLAVVQVIVYAGAIMVLFLFVVTLLNPSQRETPDQLHGQGWVAGVLAVVLLAEVAGVILSGVFGMIKTTATPPAVDWGDNVHAVGALLYSQFLFPFELTSILLLVAIVGATVLAKRRL